jgi:DNA-binding response OmpR family regulator
VRILVVEDDVSILTGVKDNLELEGYEVFCAETGREALNLARKKPPDLVVLDLMLPDLSGFDVLRQLREGGSDAFVVVLTAKKEEVDKVRGLNLGADDYITKPFSLIEFLARIKAILRRGPLKGQGMKKYSFADIEVDFENFDAQRGGEPMKLTPREFHILRYFAENPAKVISRNELLDKVWGYKTFPTTRTVDNHIMRLRKQIEANPSDPRFILSVRGVGYKFVPDTS